MPKNMGALDRIVRIALSVVVVVLALTKVIAGVLLGVLAVIAAAFVITSVIGFCPIYLPLRISTRRR